ncbi:FecR family protein [Mucilaginibacter kameinonensis]|uniref:FecR family protein n=1 Tax=Mucilaginibacter kameinonensis TaxID=452286 RepID=UPI000EF82728|nr:FecR domain-containing protein [Mucilaginibacter kameinonensis]
MEDKELNELWERFRSGQATPEDKAFLESWYLKHNQQAPFEVNDHERVEDVDQVWDNIKKKQSSKFQNGRYRLTAAAILLFVFTGTYYLLHRNVQDAASRISKTDVKPGRNQATLTLASGKKLILNNTLSGQLANEAGVTVSKNAKGELIYTTQASGNANQSAGRINTLATSKGEQYQVILPDGSHVWLNAASTLKYPVVFTGKERLVELTGEAYFEVAHNKAMPFRVKTSQQQVEVLGTHFNINAYTDEKTTATTLLEGSVKVTSASTNQKMIIKPGQQSAVSGDAMNVEEVDIDEAVAWKNGYFLFNDENLASIMKKVSRWYNVEVEYKDASLQSLVFSGTVSKYQNVSQVIKTLELTNAVHFKVLDNRITVSN